MMSSDELFDAIRGGDATGAVQLFRESSGEGVFLFQNMTPLLYCAYLGQKTVADALLEAGMVPDLYESVALGHTPDFYRNLAMHPELDALSADGWTALHLAAFFGSLEMAEELIRRGASIDVRSANAQENFALHAGLAGKAPYPLIDLLIYEGADVNARAAAGVTPLHLAASRGAGEIVKRLLDAGALETDSHGGRFPADLAIERGFTAILPLFSRIRPA